MKIRLTEAQKWLAHTPTTLSGNSTQVIAAIPAEHRAFMASVERNQEIKPAPVQENPEQLAACFQPIESVLTPRKSHRAWHGRLAARLAVLRQGTQQQGSSDDASNPTEQTND